jgi:hypothetical protein
VNQATRRRTVLGGVALTAVGGTGYLLGRSSDPVRGLRVTDSLADDERFAYVGGAGDGETLDVEVAMRERADTEQEIVLFPDSGRPARATIPPLRSFWRFSASVADRSPGSGAVRVGDASVPVERTSDPPTGDDAAVRLTPRITWQSDYLAHARGYGDETGGRLHVSFRVRTADGLTPDTLVLRGPDRSVLGRHAVPGGVFETAFDLDSVVDRDGDVELVGRRGGEEVDAFPMFSH